MNHVRELRRMSPCLDSLHQAKARHEFVRLHRSIEGADDVVGHIVLLGASWVLLSVLSDGCANGWVALPIAAVHGVDAAPGGRFVRRGLEHRRSWPAQAPRTRLNLSEGTDALIVSAASYFPLITLYAEHEDPYHCFIGRPISWSPERLRWQEMDLAAVWSEEPCEWELDAITRVDFGGRYEAALARVAELRGI